MPENQPATINLPQGGSNGLAAGSAVADRLGQIVALIEQQSGPADVAALAKLVAERFNISEGLAQDIIDGLAALRGLTDRSRLSSGEWVEFRLIVSRLMLQDCVFVDPQIRGGVPVLRGTRISISQIIAELAGSECVAELAEEYDIDSEPIRKLLEGLSIQFDRPFLK